MAERIAVLGAGAVGGLIGAYLLREGHDITLIDQWAVHVEKIKSDGLKITDLNGEFSVPAKALHISEVSDLRDKFDVVYLSVKSYDTRWSTYLIEPFLKPTGFIVPAQNCLNDELVAGIVGFNRIVGCVPSITGGVYEPGYIIRTDPLTNECFIVGELSGLITPRIQKVVSTLNVVGSSKVTTNIWGARWSKMVFSCMANALSGLIGPATRSMTEEQWDITALIRVVTGGEVVRVAQALGVAVEPIFGIPADQFIEATTNDSIRILKDKLQEALGMRRLTREQRQRLGVRLQSSFLQDTIKGRRTEIEYLNGYVVKKGEEIGVPTPMNRAIFDLFMELEKGTLKPDPSNLERLKPYLVN